jgi:glutaredoxin
LTLYRRADCELCDESRAATQVVLEARARVGETIPEYREVDVDTDSALAERFGSRVPVLALDDQELELAVSAHRIRAFLDRSLGRLV